MQSYILIYSVQAYNKGRFDSPVLPPEGPLISASSVSHGAGGWGGGGDGGGVRGEWGERGGCVYVCVWGGGGW